jgi:hypothetical protein
MVVYTNDHRPAHVHVKDADHEAVLNLNCPDGPVELRENYGFSLSALNRIAKFLQAEINTACDQWGHIHGHF